MNGMTVHTIFKNNIDYYVFEFYIIYIRENLQYGFSEDIWLLLDTYLYNLLNLIVSIL